MKPDFAACDFKGLNFYHPCDLNMNRLLGFSHLNKAGSWLFMTVLLAGNTWDQHNSIMILGKVTGISSINICYEALHPIFYVT